MKFLRSFLFTIVAISAAYFAVIGAINPRRELYGAWFPEIIPNNRARKLELLEAYQLRAPVRGLVLGSSRTMKLDPAQLEALTGKRFFNASVFAAVPEDYLAMFRAIRKRSPSIETVILGLDINGLRGDSVSGDFVSNVELRSLLEGRPPTAVDRLTHTLWLYKNTVQVSYLLDAVRSVKVAMRPSTDPINEFRADGHLRYVRWDKQMQRGTYDRQGAVDSCAAVHRSDLARYDSLSVPRKGLLDTLIGEAKGAGVHVVMLITPTHPQVLNAMASTPRIRENALRARQFYLDLAQRHGVRVFDYTDPAVFDGDPVGWYDCTHYDDRNAARLVGHMVNDGL